MMGLTHMHHTDKTHRREYTEESLRALLEGNGFRVLEILPHFNRGILNAGRALAKGNMISKLAAKSLCLQTLFYQWLGIFENRCIADWFCVGQKT